ncbi:MAG: undecaprenyldiphospho-muramoylpentapeptide beta-N-acetylglucosaminyltransferase [Saccharofermentanales bacterium]
MASKRNFTMLIGAGGTSGHINPALTLANYTKEQDPEAEIVFCGLTNSLEAEIVARAGYKLEYIRAVVLPSRGIRKKLRWLRENISGVCHCMKYIRRYKPDIVVSTGGFVGSPLVFAGLLLRKPVLLHEQNALPGRSNRFFGPFCKAVCISFAESVKYFKRKTRTVLTGNPVSAGFFKLTKDEARRKLNIAEDVFHVVMMGGSLGARSLNNAVADLVESGKWAAMIAKYPNLFLTISTGMQRGKEICQQLSAAPNITASEYLYDGLFWMASADLFVGRAGAMTCAELAALGLPSILIPYPYAADDHQTFNARTLMDVGAALMCRDQEFSAEYLHDQILMLIKDSAGLANMGKQARTKALPNATAKIHDTLLQVIRDGRD